MLKEIAVGSGMMLVTILIAGLSLWIVETLLRRAHGWLTAEPHAPKMMLLLVVAALWILSIVTVGVWAWAFTFRALGLFATMEESVYFALVTFTTLGYGDLVLAQGWRILGAMAAANGLLTFGLLTAMLVEALRHVRLGQVEARRRK
jgi:hypothetical protein